VIAAQIGAALKAKLAALSFSPEIPVAWPGRDFDPAGLDKYLVAAIENAPNERLGIKAMHRRAGSLIVTVCSRMNRGSGQGDGIADAVADHFPCDLRLDLSGGSRLRVTTAPSVRGGYQDGGTWRTPVVIPFEVLS